MSQCPKCGAVIEHDFGVTSCNQCGAVVFIDFDGQIQMADPSNASEEASVPEESSSSLSLPEQPDEIPPVQEFSGFVSEQIPEENEYVEIQDAESTPVEESNETIEDVYQAQSDLSVEPMSFENNVSELESETALSATPQDLDFSDVLEFANRAELDNSPLVYTFWIEGIDHRETRLRVEAVLSEPRLNFHLKDILPTIRGGVLELRGLNPAKTNYIANRLREESVDFRWQQTVYEAEDAGEEIAPTGTDI